MTTTADIREAGTTMNTTTQPHELECSHVSAHHSDDRVLIYAGRASGPVVACGFHATHFLAETLNKH